MSVELILSNTSYHANDMMTKRLQERRKNGSIRHIVLVPDKFALSTEKSILEDLSLFGAFDITVTSFNKLAKLVLGKKASNSMSAEGSVMLLSKVILFVKDKLCYFVNAHKKSGFASEVYAAITQVRNSGVTVEALDRASKSLPELARKKCQDIVTIYRAYLEELSKGYIDGNTVLDNLKSEIPESDYIAESDIYIRDFFSFTEAQRSVIFALMKSAKSVSIALVQGKGKNCRIYPEKELLRLRSLAKKSGASFSEFYQNAPLPPAYEKVANELFSYGDIKKTKGGEGIVIYEAESVKEEILHLARRIKLLVKQGYRYKDISVLAGDMEGYLPLIKKIFAQEDIPYFANEQKILSATPISEFLTSSIKASIDGIEKDRALTLLKNPYADVDEKDISDFDIYTIKYNVNYSRLLGEYTLGESDTKIEGAKRAGKKLKTLLIDMPKKAKVYEFVQIVSDFIQKLALKEKCEVYAKAQSDTGDLLNSSCTKQSYDKLVNALEELEKYVGESEIDNESFLSMLDNAMCSIKINFIPVYLDCVYVGGAKEDRFSDVKAFFMIGAKEGVLPSIQRREGIFGDADAELLKQAEVELSPTSIEAGLEEKLHVLQLFLMPKEKLFISYVNTGKTTSEIASSLLNLFCDVQKTNAKLLEKENHDEYISLLLSSKSSAKKALLIESLDEQTQIEIESVVGKASKIEKQEVENVDCGKELFFPYKTTSVTKIEKYFSCPYRNYIENGLNVRKLETAQSTSYVGTFMHRVFEVGVKRLVENGYPEGREFDELVANVLREVLLEEEFGALNTEKYLSTKKRLIEEGYRSLRLTMQRCKRSNYAPAGFEVRFGDKVKFELVGKDVSLALHGCIDRIDERDGKALLLDYKTGSMPASISDVYYGTGVQLYVYMSAVEKEIGKPTTGALYYPLVGGYESQDKNSARLDGFILSGEMLEFDISFDPTKESSTFAYSVKGGKPTKEGEKISCTQEELEGIKEYSIKVCEGAIDEMTSGYIAPTPLGGVCKYCDYAIVCKNKIVKSRKISNVDKSFITGGKKNG